MTLKGCRRPIDDSTQMEFIRTLAKCTIEAFKLQTRTVNSMEFTKVDYEPDALSGGDVPHRFHKLTFQRSRITLTPFRDDGSPTQIQDLTFTYIKLRSFQTYYYNSFQTLSLSIIFVDTRFFRTLGRICSKLKALELGMGPIRVHGNEGVIDIQDLMLQRLDLAILPRDFSEYPWLVVVKTHKEYAYIKIHKNRRYNVLTYEEAMEEERQTQFSERYHIYCYDIQEVFRSNKKITLYRNSTSSNIA
ncbi:hypothetical protein CU097_011732 [Rhizopus azygosporus]|uniref:Uncharacterized protein n=1 Tax=Rhizopus azygosporus TaxID=86630 RepID=A0A367JL33_RHIAZ|nr:hypothetical protein CU097_011732 [Rhizopus azygosporus]